MFAIPRMTLLLFFLAAFLTVMANIFVEQYEDVGPQILHNSQFSNELEGWNVHTAEGGMIRVNNGIVSLENHEPRGTVEIVQELRGLPHGERFHFSTDSRCRNVVQGERGWNKARLLFVQRDNEKSYYGVPHVLVANTGTHEWNRESKIFQIDDKTSVVRVSIQLSQSCGEFSVKNPSVLQVRQNWLYGLFKWLAISLWLVFLWGLIRSYWRSSGTGAVKVLLGIIVVLIVFGVSIPGRLKNELRDDMMSGVGEHSVSSGPAAADTHPASRLLNVDITKWGHFFLFASFAILLILGNEKKSVGLAVQYILLVAAATELLQFYIEGRSPLFLDFFIDMSGGLVGILIWFCLFHNRAQREDLR